MKRFIIEQSDEEFYTSHSGIALVGLALNRFTSLSSALAAMDAPGDLIAGEDIIRSFCALLAQGKSDFVTVEQYLSLPAYLGTEGWMVNQHLLPGSQHPQNGFIAFIRETLARVRQFCKQKLLIRADSAHDAIANMAELSRHRRVDFIIKWNPRKQDKLAWAAYSFANGKITTPRAGKRVAVFSVKEKHTFTDADGIERTVTLRRVTRVTERATDKKGQMLLEPDFIAKTLL